MPLVGGTPGWLCFPFTSWARLAWAIRQNFLQRIQKARPGTSRTCTSWTVHPFLAHRVSTQWFLSNPEGFPWDVKNLYVMDGSSFPSASGVNPMVSIESRRPDLGRQELVRHGRFILS